MPLIFLSYASEDDFTPEKKSGGWVTVIQKALELELSRLKGAKLWRDNRDFDLPGAVRDKLSDVIKDTDYLLPVLSLDYNRKAYTRFEISEFFQVRRAKGVVEPTDYIIPLMPRPFAEDQFLDELSGLKWVSFFEPADAASYTPFVEPDGKKSEKFWAAVRSVVSLIEQQMKLQPPEKPNATVYLARTADDQMNNKWSVENELDAQKCRITPKPPWPVSQPDATSFLSKSLSESQFSISSARRHIGTRAAFRSDRIVSIAARTRRRASEEGRCVSPADLDSPRYEDNGSGATKTYRRPRQRLPAD